MWSIDYLKIFSFWRSSLDLLFRILLIEKPRRPSESILLLLESIWGSASGLFTLTRPIFYYELDLWCLSFLEPSNSTSCVSFFGMTIYLLEQAFKGNFFIPSLPNFSLIFLGSILRILFELAWTESYIVIRSQRYFLIFTGSFFGPSTTISTFLASYKVYWSGI